MNRFVTVWAFAVACLCAGVAGAEVPIGMDFGGAPAATLPFSLFRSESVVKELELTADQKSQTTSLANDVNRQLQEFASGMQGDFRKLADKSPFERTSG